MSFGFYKDWFIYKFYSLFLYIYLQVTELLYKHPEYQEVIITSLSVLANKLAKYYFKQLTQIKKSKNDTNLKKIDEDTQAACKLTRVTNELRPVSEPDNNWNLSQK